MYKPFFEITNEILARIAKIEELRSTARTFRILPEREAFIHNRATVEATHSSTSIEGNPLSLKQVEKVLKSNSRLTKEQYAEIEVKNYKKSLDWITKRKRTKKPLDITDVMELHKIITGSLLDDSRSGKFRQNPVYVVDQNDEVVYEAPEASRVEPELKAFFAWLNNPENKTHPVIIAGILHYIIVSIHPFADGNGRTARAAVSLYLSLVNYDFRESLVLDSYYAVDKKTYYDTLKITQQGAYTKAINADLTPWLEYFTEGFLSSVEILMLELRTLSIIQGSTTFKRLSRDESDIISYITEFGSINLSEAQEILPDISRRTLQRIISKLVSNGYIRADGNGPATKYVLMNNK